jgi:hypothetical protein
MEQNFSQEGSGGIDPPGSGGIRGVAPPDQHSPVVSLPPTGDSRVDEAPRERGDPGGRPPGPAQSRGITSPDR